MPSSLIDSLTPLPADTRTSIPNPITNKILAIPKSTNGTPPGKTSLIKIFTIVSSTENYTLSAIMSPLRKFNGIEQFSMTKMTSKSGRKWCTGEAIPNTSLKSSIFHFKTKAKSACLSFSSTFSSKESRSDWSTWLTYLTHKIFTFYSASSKVLSTSFHRHFL